MMSNGMDERITADLLLETMAEGVLVVDMEGVISSWNAAMTEMTGYRREEAIGKPGGYLRSSECRGGKQLQDLLDIQTTVDHPCINGCECRLLSKTGEEIPVLVNARALHAADGAVLGLLQTVTDFRPVAHLRKELEAMEAKLMPEDTFHGLVGHSNAMQHVQRMIGLAAESEATVLILGPSGTGKEVAATAVHELSGRRAQPFIKVNCGALTETLLESELFGHVKGAYTGAYRDRKGRFESADGGTIFLDEIGEISPAMQVKLLRVLQEGEFERVGSGETVRVNVRVIAATNRDLPEEMRAGAFREDLYYRLRVFPIVMPPLGARREDIPLLAQFFINCYAAKTGRLISGIGNDAMHALMHYCWPGNVRELENAIEYAFVVCRTDQIALGDLPDEVRNPQMRADRCNAMGAGVRAVAGDGFEVVRDPVRLRSVLEECGWNKAEVARRLSVSRTAVWKWMKKHGIPLKAGVL